VRRTMRALTLVLLIALGLSAVRAPVALANGSSWSPVATSAAIEGPPGPIVKQAFDLLMDRFVIPPSSGDILNGAWEGGLAVLKEKGVEALPDGRPTFAGERDVDWALFAEQYGRLARAAGDKLDKAELDRGIVRGMAVALKEGHTYFLTPDEFGRAREQLRNNERFVGIGVIFNRELVVLEVLDGSPAEKGGLRIGDRLIAVDGTSIEGKPLPEVSPRIRGASGTSVELTVRRVDRSEPLVLSFVRAEIQLRWVSHRIIEGDVGYLRLRNFPLRSALDEFRAAMTRFQDAGVKALVIDLRGNPGGSVDTGIEVASSFIRSGPLFQQVDRGGGERTITAFGDHWDRDIPIAVLVDGNSGSMSEILASAMQETGTARVIGTKTSGNVAAAIPTPLADGSGLFITVQVIKSGQGKTLNEVGLEPDQVVELDQRQLAAGRDSQLDAALTYVREEATARAATSSALPALPRAA
jgi:carboxyl-terminal processing protease